MGTVYFARWILTDNDEILENGAISVSGDSIVSVGPRSRVKRNSDDRIVNLGDILLLPGLIDMHTHLEENGIRGLRKEPEETITAFSLKRASRVRQIPEKTIQAGVMLTVRELLTNGITGVVDSSRLNLSPSVLSHESIRSWVIHELHADDPVQEEQLLGTILERIETPHLTGKGVGPFGIFSLSPKAQRMVIDLSYEKNLLWACHLAESAEELQAFSEKTGDLYFHITRKRQWPFGETLMGPMNYAITANLIPNGGICFHCNYANGHELALLAAKRIALVICRQYSEILGHKSFPLDVALSRGCLICIGTEGISDPGFMCLFDELYALKTAYPHIPARDMLKWVTKNPSIALRMGDKLGSLTAGKFADIIGVRFAHDTGQDLIEELLVEDPDVVFVMVNGEELIINT